MTSIGPPRSRGVPEVKRTVGRYDAWTPRPRSPNSCPYPETLTSLTGPLLGLAAALGGRVSAITPSSGLYPGHPDTLKIPRDLRLSGRVWRLRRDYHAGVLPLTPSLTHRKPAGPSSDVTGGWMAARTNDSPVDSVSPLRAYWRHHRSKINEPVIICLKMGHSEQIVESKQRCDRSRAESAQLVDSNQPV